MTNNTIQDRLNYFALKGTRDAIHENRMVINRRRRHSAPINATEIEPNNGLAVKKSTQLSLF